MQKRSRKLSLALFALAIGSIRASEGQALTTQKSDLDLKGYGITVTGLKPKYPPGLSCSPLTSLYASWIDVDGSRRDEPHSGVDGGRFGDPILAPGPGTVKAVWHANWGWGPDAALLIVHRRAELNMTEGPEFYFSEFDHLRYADISHLKIGDKIARGEKLARVFVPGSDREYLPEVHWEVWELEHNTDLTWRTNKSGGRYWTNDTARLIDPLYMLSRNSPPAENGDVALMPFLNGSDYDEFRGFTYILPCHKRG